jgi:hypothetical protein
MVQPATPAPGRSIPVTRRVSILLASLLLSACEFVSVGVPPLPGVPLGSTANTNVTAPPTEDQIQAMSTPELCWYIAFAGYSETRDSAYLELDARATYTEEEMALIRERRVDVGMTSSAVRCVIGPPGRELTRNDDYDVVYVYGSGFTSESGSRETRIYFEENIVARVENPLPYEPPRQNPVFTDSGSRVLPLPPAAGP